jgi:hypothetical protein
VLRLWICIGRHKEAIFATGFLPPEIQAEMHSREASLGNRTNLLRL